MNRSRASYRYAGALIKVAEEQNKLSEVAKNLEFLNRAINEIREFRVFLKSPVISTEKKKQVLNAILINRADELTRRLVLLLAAKDREALLPDIIKQFTELCDQRLGFLRVVIKTAVKLTPEQEQNLVARLERTTKKKIKLETYLDPSLNGGFVVQYEDTVWDASVQHQLEKLKQQMTEYAAQI